ncbi:unnamed protein product [Echinostoma caproni]|uniref:Uncharacterized protein n=1 Tax=Echinostoma caproni TaxID=27848 RepID=A0A183ANS9_9TREM|nr:unnamed protein product [Echinostoma caproni]
MIRPTVMIAFLFLVLILTEESEAMMRGPGRRQTPPPPPPPPKRRPQPKPHMQEKKPEEDLLNQFCGLNDTQTNYTKLDGDHTEPPNQSTPAPTTTASV